MPAIIPTSYKVQFSTAGMAWKETQRNAFFLTPEAQARIRKLFARAFPILCPHGFGETDLVQCLDRTADKKVRKTCLRCPLPVILIALDGQDAVNQAVAARLVRALSCPWPKPAYTGFVPHTIPRAKGLAMALSAAMRTKAGQTRISLSDLRRRFNAIPGAPDLPDVATLRTLIRTQGLRMDRLANNTFVLPVTDHVRAFVRSYKVEK